jgi:hypothetical protein
LVRPIARRSFFAGGGSGAVPDALTTRRTSNPSVSILWSPVSTARATTCTPPARLAVGATAKVSPAVLTPAFFATQSATSSVGSVRVSSTSTPRGMSSA